MKAFKQAAEKARAAVQRLSVLLRQFLERRIAANQPPCEEVKRRTCPSGLVPTPGCETFIPSYRSRQVISDFLKFGPDHETDVRDAPLALLARAGESEAKEAPKLILFDLRAYLSSQSAGVSASVVEHSSAALRP